MSPNDTCYVRAFGSRVKIAIPHDLQPVESDDLKATCVYCGKVMARERIGDGKQRG